VVSARGGLAFAIGTCNLCYTILKKPLTFLSFLLVTIGALAQGQVNFAPRVVGLYDAPVYLDCVGLGPKLEGSRYLVQLYAGPTQTSLAPVGNPLPFLTGADAGYWADTVVTVNRVDANGRAFFQVRAWDTAYGPTYEAVVANVGYFGVSSTLAFNPTVAPDLPAPLYGLSSFAVVHPLIGGNSSCVPEPSIVLLAVLGSVPFLLRRQSNRR
jgi:hypothetical protein